MGASQFLQMGTGAFNSLSRTQFGSTTLSGRNINSAHKGADIGLGDHGSPLALKADTIGSNAATTAWRQSTVMPYSKRTSGSTFSWGE